MAKLDLELNKTYIVEENDKIFSIKLYNYSKNELFIKVEESGSNKFRWRNVLDFKDSIKILDEVEENKSIEKPIDQPILSTPVSPTNQSPISSSFLPYSNNYNMNKIQTLISNIESIINQYKQSK